MEQENETKKVISLTKFVIKHQNLIHEFRDTGAKYRMYIQNKLCTYVDIYIHFLHFSDTQCIILLTYTAMSNLEQAVHTNKPETSRLLISSSARRRFYNSS